MANEWVWAQDVSSVRREWEPRMAILPVDQQTCEVASDGVPQTNWSYY